MMKRQERRYQRRRNIPHGLYQQQHGHLQQRLIAGDKSQLGGVAPHQLYQIGQEGVGGIGGHVEHHREHKEGDKIVVLEHPAQLKLLKGPVLLLRLL